mgnify:CR=1 FL=1
MLAHLLHFFTSNKTKPKLFLLQRSSTSAAAAGAASSSSSEDKENGENAPPSSPTAPFHLAMPVADITAARAFYGG